MEEKKERNWIERMEDTYRLVLMNDDTFEEIGTYRLSRLNIYGLIGGVILATALLVAMLIVFSPIKRYIPGYADYRASSEFIELNEQLDEIESQIDAQRVYTENFKKILVGDVDTTAKEGEAEAQFDESQLNVERIEEDEQLRKEVQLDEVRQVSQSGTNQNREVIQSARLEHINFSAPIKGEISAGFMPEKKHMGVDVLAPKNTAIKAVLDGVVISSDWTLETGNTISIQHPNNIISFYKHNSKLLKKTGEVVKAGEAIAIIGNTGTLSDGPHLHFELWYRGKPINPSDYVIF